MSIVRVGVVLLVLLLARGAWGDDPKLWLAVTTAELAESLQPLAEYRRGQGLDAVVFVGTPDDALAEHPSPDYLLLVGDAPTAGEEANAAWYVPARSFSLYRWIATQRKTFLSDSMWGDLNGDGNPDVCVGRIPARTAAEVAVVVNKIKAYEGRPWSIDDLRVPAWTGTPMATPAFNRIATGLVISQLKAQLPKWAEVSLICGDPQSALCGWPDEQSATFNRWLKRGGLVATVGAHGNEFGWVSLTEGGRWVTYEVGTDDAPLASGSPCCPLIVLTCDSGNFAAPRRCVTEAMLLAPGGPVAAIGATTQSHPLTNALTVRGMLPAFHERPRRLGDLWLAAQVAGHDTRDLLLETMLKDLEGSIDEEIDVAQLRRDQLRMYALLGDPATKIRIPHPLSASIERTGDGWTWHVERPAGARRLHIGFRPATAGMPARPKDIDRDAAARLLDEANRMFGFQEVATLTTEEEWQGVVEQPGILRLAVLAEDDWHVTTLKSADGEAE